MGLGQRLKINIFKKNVNYHSLFERMNTKEPLSVTASEAHRVEYAVAKTVAWLGAHSNCPHPKTLPALMNFIRASGFGKVLVKTGLATVVKSLAGVPEGVTWFSERRRGSRNVGMCGPSTGRYGPPTASALRRCAVGWRLCRERRSWRCWWRGA